jgi:ketosteroid isomerase-like protein
MAEKENVELVQGFYAATGQGDMESVLSLLGADVEVIYPGPSIIPTAGVWHGHDGFARWSSAGLAGHLPPEAFELKEFIAQGDKVVVVGHADLRIKTTGKACSTDFLHFFTVRDGKISSFRDYFDTHALAMAYVP